MVHLARGTIMNTEKRDLTAVLPDGRDFEFWETDCTFSRTLFVDCQNPAASDENDGSEHAPFRSINKAAALAQPGTKILIPLTLCSLYFLFHRYPAAPPTIPPRIWENCDTVSCTKIPS